MTLNRPWSEEDKAMVLDNPDMDNHVLAEKLGRTYASVIQVRHRAKTPYKKNTEDFDRRPSGWYGETVGTLLMSYAPAWETWKHYHRYVEVKIVGEDTRGWTSLLCRRDADAP